VVVYLWTAESKKNFLDNMWWTGSSEKVAMQICLFGRLLTQEKETGEKEDWRIAGEERL
jgi:hypothetical protein